MRKIKKTKLPWGKLVKGQLIRRYKRFLADIELENGEIVTAHTANTGRMTGCSEPGRPVWLSVHADRPKRKYLYTLEMIDMPEALVGVNTTVPNKLLALAAARGELPGLPFPCQVRPEIRHGQSRLDLLLSAPGLPDTFVEIKNCSLVEAGTAFFPDAVSARGARHLEELSALAGAGARAVIFILAQRGDARVFSPADHIDPAWGAALRRALAAGVELMAWRAELDMEGIALGAPLPVRL